MKNENGNGKSKNISIYDENWLPKISEMVNKLSDTEKKTVEVMVVKNPSETWQSVAKKIGITTRQLYNIRQSENVQTICYQISKELFKSELPDVLKTLAKKAKAGHSWAVRLFLEVAGELKEDKKEKPIGEQYVSNSWRLNETAKDTLEKMKLMSDAELIDAINERMRDAEYKG